MPAFNSRVMVLVDPGPYKAARNFVVFVLSENFERSSSLASPGCLVSTSATADEFVVRTKTANVNSRTPRTRPRSRFGYDHRWWGEAPPAAAGDSSYWSATRRPIPCLIFILPALLAYEIGVAWLGGGSGAIRAGADSWMRHALGVLGLTDRWLPPLALVLTLVGWQAVDRRDWKFSPMLVPGMALESFLLAVALIGLSRMVDLGFARLDAPEVLAAGLAHPAAPLVGFLGAGLYEEALFRLALVPLIYWAAKLILLPGVIAGTLAISGSALLFSLAHHAGAPGESFTWFAFIFRWLAGVYFAWVFVARGFGVAVGTHTAYDVIVGWFGWHF
jgi:hypothetical protein